MSVFGTNQVEELIVGDAVATETTVATFIASASDKEIKVLSADGSAPAEGEEFKVFQKTADGYEVSQSIKAEEVDKVILGTYSPEVQKSVSVEGFDGNVLANHTYIVEIKLYGDLSQENFTNIQGSYVTGSNVTGVTAADIRDGIVTSIQKNLDKRGGNEFTITTPNTSETDIVITAQDQKVVVGKIQGRQLEFSVAGRVYDNSALIDENLGLLTTTVLQGNDPGRGTGKYAVNLEWFLNGFKYDVYRQTAYPADFVTPQYTSLGTNYNAIHIISYNTRKSTIQENQRRVTTILVEFTDLASNAATNGVLADLRTILGTDNVPANLAVA